MKPITKEDIEKIKNFNKWRLSKELTEILFYDNTFRIEVLGNET